MGDVRGFDQQLPGVSPNGGRSYGGGTVMLVAVPTTTRPRRLGPGTVMLALAAGLGLVYALKLRKH